jgi:cytochrome o ubiquinol oxidase operon protein cyoD
MSSNQESQHAGSLSDYVKGFIFSVVLTAIPFALVMTRVISSNQTTVMIILVLALMQVLVHLKYFLHITVKGESGWNILSLLFTTVLVVIMFSGSVWVMYNLNHNMMPMVPTESGIT